MSSPWLNWTPKDQDANKNLSEKDAKFSETSKSSTDITDNKIEGNHLMSVVSVGNEGIFEKNTKENSRIFFQTSKKSTDITDNKIKEDDLMSAMSVGNEGIFEKKESFVNDISLFYEHNGIEQLILNPKKEHFNKAKLAAYFTLWNVTTGEVIEQKGSFPVAPTKKLQPTDDWLNVLKELFDSHSLNPKHDHKLMATWQALDVGVIDQQKAIENYKEVAEELGLISTELVSKTKEVAKSDQIPTTTSNLGES